MSSEHLKTKEPNTSGDLLDHLRLSLVDEAVELMGRRKYGTALRAIIAIGRIESGDIKKAAPHLEQFDFEIEYAAAQAPEHAPE